ncbi:condensation domain-containing protein [Streptomyces asiaticus]
MTRPSDPVPLSPQQEWLWESLRFMHPDEPGRTKSNVCLAYTLRGPVDADRLERALNTVRRRHDTLRTTFDEISDAPRQEIQDPWDAQPLPFALVDLAGVPYQEQHRLCEVIANGECDRVFDYVRGPLWHVTLVRRTPREHVLVFSVSHLMLDAPSVQLVIRHLAEAYEELPPPERQDQYRDFVCRARELPKDAEKHLDYWRRVLTPLPAPLDVPTDYPAAPPPVFLRETEPFSVQAPTAELADLRGQAGVTPYLIHVAAYTAALAGICGARRIVVGSSLTRLELKADLNAVGHFSDLVLLPVDVRPEHTFGEHLEHVRDTVLDVYDNLLPYQVIAEAIDPDFKARRPWPARALYNVWVRGSVHSTDLGPPKRIGEAEVSPFSFAHETCYSIDLDADRYAHVYGQNVVPTLYIGPTGLDGEMTYNRAVFTPPSARRFTDMHRRNLERLLRERGTPIGEVQA